MIWSPAGVVTFIRGTEASCRAPSLFVQHLDTAGGVGARPGRGEPPAEPPVLGKPFTSRVVLCGSLGLTLVPHSSLLTAVPAVKNTWRGPRPRLRPGL